MRRSVTLFVSLTLAAVTLLSFALVLMFGRQDAGALVVLGMPIPFLIALLVERLRPSGRPFAEVFATRVRRTRVGTGLAVAVAALFGVLAFQLLAATGLSITEWRLPDAAGPLALAFAVQFGVMLVGSLGEELGWRGWLQSRMQAAGFAATVAVTAVAWAAFHVPILALTGDLGWAGWVATIGNIVAASPLLAALRLRFGSVWPAVLAHALMNSLFVLGHNQFVVRPEAAWSVVAFAALGWVAWLAAAFLVLRLGRRDAGDGKRLAI